MSANVIKQLLKQRELNACRIAKDLGVDSSLVYRTINGHSCSSRKVRIYISKKLGFSPSQLFTHLSPDVVSIDDHLFLKSLMSSEKV